MMSPLQIVWKGVDASEALEDRIRGEVEDLEEMFDRITSCRVAVEKPNGGHHRHGGHYHIKIELMVPGRTLAVTRDPQEHKNGEDAYAAVNEAFGSMRRQLHEFVRVQRGFVKTHERPS